MSLHGLAQSGSQPAAAASQPSPPAKINTENAAASSTTTASSPLVLSHLLGDARSLYRKGNFDAAIAKYQEFLATHPKSPDAYAGLVRVYLKQKKIELAAQTAEQGLAQSDSRRVRTARAEVWFRQGRISDAENEWVKVINSGYPEARAYLGASRVRDALAMYKSAKTMIDKAHLLDPDDPDIQEEWIGTFSPAERIKYLEFSLAGDNSWDEEKRANIARYLKYLQERARQKRTSPCRLVSKVTSMETPMVRLLLGPNRLRGFGLSVILNGHKSSLLLDTGASGIIVKRSIAEHAGLSKITETQVWGIGSKGGRSAYHSIADSIKVGDLEFQNCPVEVMESNSVAGEDGLIGTDVFQQFLLDLDFPDEKLRLSGLPKRPNVVQQNFALSSEDGDSDDAEPASDKSDTDKSGANEPAKDKPANASVGTANVASTPAASGPQDRYIAPEMRSYTQVFRFGHDLLIPTTIGNVPSKLFVLDTGGFNNTISPAAAREVTKVHNDDMIVKGISGKVDKVYSANKAVLTFGRLRQENQDMTAFDNTVISDSIGTEVSGFLGFALLRLLEIKIDYRDALVDFQYDAKRGNR